MFVDVHLWIFCTCALSTIIKGSSSSLVILNPDLSPQGKPNLPTVTVRGFLNFRTTVDGTIIVFTPASATASDEAKSSNVPYIASTRESQRIAPTASYTSHSSMSFTTPPVEVSSPQPVIKDQYPTGLVTVLKGAVVHDGVTTMYETQVVGTYIDGKYAQILKSTSVVNRPPSEPTTTFVLPKIEPTQTVLSPVRPTATPNKIVLKATAPKLHSKLVEISHNRAPVTEKENSLQPSFKHREFLFKPEPTSHTSKILKSRFGRLNISDKKSETTTTTEASTNKIKIRVPGGGGSRRVTWKPRAAPRVTMNRFKTKLMTNRDKIEEEAAKEINQRFQNRLGLQKPKEEPKIKVRAFPKLEVAKPEAPKVETPKPEIPKAEDSKPEIAYKPPIFSFGDINENQNERQLESSQIEPHKVVKEVQTITSEVTRHVDGTHLKVDTVTLTTTVQRSVHPSEFDEIQGSTAAIVADGNAVDAPTVEETPPIVISRTYSVTERSMRTTVVPVFDGTLTTNHTVTESFFIRKLITAYKTMPPGDINLLETASLEMNNSSYFENMPGTDTNIVPSVFEGKIEIRGSEDENSIHPTVALYSPPASATLDPSLNGPMQQFTNPLPSFPSIDLNNPLIVGAALRNPQLAAIYFGLQQMQQQATQYDTVVKPTQVVTTETIYNTKTISFYDGRQTRTRTIVEPSSTVEKTIQTYTTEVTPVVNPQLMMQQAQLQQMFATQLLGQNAAFQFPAQQQQAQFPQQQQFRTITNTIVTPTTIVNTKTKVYTLVYNAFSTKYRTVTSTSVVPTTVTLYSTTTVGNTAFNPFFG